jgi:hypothetical protein
VDLPSPARTRSLFCRSLNSRLLPNRTETGIGMRCETRPTLQAGVATAKDPDRRAWAGPFRNPLVLKPQAHCFRDQAYASALRRSRSPSRSLLLQEARPAAMQARRHCSTLTRRGALLARIPDSVPSNELRLRGLSFVGFKATAGSNGKLKLVSIEPAGLWRLPWRPTSTFVSAGFWRSRDLRQWPVGARTCPPS